MMRPVLLAAIVAASGFAGLAYEIVWTRMLAATLGTEMIATLGVVTGFFAGLAAGAFALDRAIGRAADPRRSYAVLEATIALWSLASIWLLPASGPWLAAVLGPAPPPGLLWLAGFAMPALLLLPATAAMGGTMIALERIVAPLSESGRVVAGIYGANTAGATFGCLASVFLLMPTLGLSRTLAALAAINMLGALAVFLLPRPPCVAARPALALKLGRPRMLLTLTGTGLLGIALETLVIRLAAQILQNTIFSFAALLAAYLLGTAIGGLLWQQARRPPSPAAIALLLAAASLATTMTAAIVLWLGPAALSIGIEEFLVAGALFLVPAAAMGALFGCLAQAWRDGGGSLGDAIGVNAAGAALAPALAALLLIPLVGAAAGLVAIATAFLLFLPLPPRRAATFAAVPLAASLVIALLWPDRALVRIPPEGRLLASREGPTATASVVTDADATRFLEINGQFRMGGTSSRRSDWRQAQIPLLMHPAPHRALFLGVGTGATLAGAGAWPGLTATGVELVPEAVDLLPWFTEPALPAIVTADARRFVRADLAQYDVIVADLFHPALDGSGALYTEEHFAAIRQRLAPGGVFCQWLPLYQLDQPSLGAIIRTFQAVFPGASAWLAHYSLQTPMLALVGAPGGLDLDPARLAQTMSGPAMRQTGLLQPTDLLGLFVGGPRTLEAIAGPGPRNTDDRPFVALDARRNLHALSAPPAALLLDLLGRAGMVPSDPPGAGALAPRIAAYRRARDTFIVAGAAIEPGLEPRALMNAAIPGLLNALQLSPDFDPAYDPLVAMARSLLGPEADRDDRNAAIRILRAAQQAAPSRPEAPLLLARFREP